MNKYSRAGQRDSRKIRLTLRNVNQLERYVNELKHTISGERANELAYEYGDRVLGHFIKIIQNTVDENPRHNHEHVDNIISSCYYTVSPKGNNNFSIKIGNNSPKFKYLEYGTGKTGFKTKDDYGDNPESKGWQYMIGKTIVRTMGKNKYWTVRMFPTGKKYLLSDAKGGWFFQYKSQRMFTFGQPGIFATTQLRRMVDSADGNEELAKMIKIKLPTIPHFD